MASITPPSSVTISPSGMVIEPIIRTADDAAAVAAVAQPVLSRSPSPPHSSSDSGSNTPPPAEPVSFNPPRPTDHFGNGSIHFEPQAVDLNPYRKAMQISGLIRRLKRDFSPRLSHNQVVRDDFDLGIRSKKPRTRFLAEELDLHEAQIQPDEFEQNKVEIESIEYYKVEIESIEYYVNQIYTKLGTKHRLNAEEQAAYLPILQKLETFVRMKAGLPLKKEKAPRPGPPPMRSISVHGVAAPPSSTSSSPNAGEAMAEAVINFQHIQAFASQTAGLPPPNPLSSSISATTSPPAHAAPPQPALDPSFVRRMHITQIAGVVAAVAGLILTIVMTPYFFLLFWGGAELGVATMRAEDAAKKNKRATPHRVFFYFPMLRIINTIFFQQPLKFFTHPAQNPAEPIPESSPVEAPPH